MQMSDDVEARLAAVRVTSHVVRHGSQVPVRETNQSADRMGLRSLRAGKNL